MKSLRICFLIFFTQIVVFSTSAQVSVPMVPLDSVLVAYHESTIYLDGNGKFIKNKSKFPMGFFGNRLKKELSSSPEALAMFKKYRQQTWQGIAIMTVSFVGGMTLIAATGNPVFALCIVPYFAGAMQAANANHLYYQAIWIYNGDAMLSRLKHMPR